MKSKITEISLVVLNDLDKNEILLVIKFRKYKTNLNSICSGEGFVNQLNLMFPGRTVFQI